MEKLIFGKGKLTSRRSNRHGIGSTEPDGSQSYRKQIRLFDHFSRSNTSLLAPGSVELKGEHGAERTNTLPTFNVVLFGETGVGKSSVINLIARKDIAKVSTDIDGCTMQSTRYDISFDGMDFAIFDTIGLEEPHFGVNGYLKAIEKAYELIMRLSAAGGVHLLLFCLRGGRITATAQSNYRLFCECLCSKKVPIALIFTGLEMEDEMENWWRRNKTHVEHYGIHSVGHACITAVQDDTPEQTLKYTESKRIIRELLKKHAAKSEAFSPDTVAWYARLGSRMKSFIAKRRSPKRRDIVKVLTQRCKLDPDTARRIADMMEKEDKATNDEKNAEAAAATDGDNLTKTADREKGDADGPPTDTADTNKKDDTATRNEGQVPQAGPPDSRVTLDHDTVGEVADAGAEDAQTNGNQVSQVTAIVRHPISGLPEGGDGGEGAENAVSTNQPGYIEVVPDESWVALESLAEDHPLPNQSIGVETRPPVMESVDAAVSITQPCVERMHGEDGGRRKSRKKGDDAQPNRAEAHTGMAVRKYDGGKSATVPPATIRMNSGRSRKDGLPGDPAGKAGRPPPLNPNFRLPRSGSASKQVSVDPS